jgi:hypothetical protein
VRRNYYRCSAEGCSVKKRMERTTRATYDGVNNHAAPVASYLCLSPRRSATPFSPPCSASSIDDWRASGGSVQLERRL